MNNDNEYMHMHLDTLAKKQLKSNWSWFLILGICLVVLGSLAVMFSLVSTIVSIEYLGFLMLFVGFFEGAKCLKMSRWSSFFLHLFLCVMYCVAGVFIVSNPEANAVTLTLLLAIFFVISGILRIIFAYAKNVPHQGWLILNGALSVFLGILIWQQWPSSGLWVLGTLMGIDILFTGWTWIMLALRAKSIDVDERKL